MTSDAATPRQGRIAISALFLLNGAILGSWAPQIPLLLPRHDITESVLGFVQCSESGIRHGFGRRGLAHAHTGPRLRQERART